ncbi:MAG: DUF4239 domain-containing protein [Candidatus Omnitrophica bacterium]|nr:DUF4239 domain-containing protein [Candidatus Omnitrophota bacterium]
MAFNQMLIVFVPPLALGVFIVGISIALSYLGLIMTRKIISHDKLLLHNDVVGPLFETVGVVYAVILAFVVIVSWQNYDRSNLNVQKEASCLASLYSDCEAFSSAQKIEIRNLLEEYAKTTINDEWAKMGVASSSSIVAQKVHSMRSFYSKLAPRNKTEEIYLAESLRKLNELTEYRDNRLLDAKEGIHPILWFMLISGAVITMTISFLFGTKNYGAQKVMTILLATIISLTLFTILELD